MALPKISHPNVSITIPSTGKVRRFRPFLTRDEKILLMAKQSGENRDIMTAVIQMVLGCSTDDLTAEQITTFDAEYIFLKLRAASVENVVKAAYKDSEDEEVREFDVDLDKVETIFPEESKGDNRIISVSKDTKISLRYPRAILFMSEDFYGTNGEDKALMKILTECIDFISVGEEIHKFEDATEDERTEFVNDLDIKTLGKLQTFIANQPHLYYKIEYKNNNGKERIIELTTLHDFFILR